MRVDPTNRTAILRSLQYRMKLRGEAAKQVSSTSTQKAETATNDGKPAAIDAQVQQALLRLACGTEIDITMMHEGNDKAESTATTVKHKVQKDASATTRGKSKHRHRHETRVHVNDGSSNNNNDITKCAEPAKEGKGPTQGNSQGRSFTLFPFRNQELLDRIVARYHTSDEDDEEKDKTTSPQKEEEAVPSSIAHIYIHCCGPEGNAVKVESAANANTVTPTTGGSTDHTAKPNTTSVGSPLSSLSPPRTLAPSSPRASSPLSLPPPPPTSSVPLPPSSTVPLPPPPTSSVPLPPPPTTSVPLPPPPATSVPLPPPPPSTSAFSPLLGSRPPLTATPSAATSTAPPPPPPTTTKPSTTTTTSGNGGSKANEAQEREKVLLEQATRYVAGLEAEVEHSAQHRELAARQLAEEAMRGNALRHDRDALLRLTSQLEQDNAELQYVLERSSAQRRRALPPPLLTDSSTSTSSSTEESSSSSDSTPILSHDKEAETEEKAKDESNNGKDATPLPPLTDASLDNFPAEVREVYRALQTSITAPVPETSARTQEQPQQASAAAVNVPAVDTANVTQPQQQTLTQNTTIAAAPLHTTSPAKPTQTVPVPLRTTDVDPITAKMERYLPHLHNRLAHTRLEDLEQYIDHLWQEAQHGSAHVQHTLQRSAAISSSLPPLPAAPPVYIAATKIASTPPPAKVTTKPTPATYNNASTMTTTVPPPQPSVNVTRRQAELEQLRREVAAEGAAMKREAERWHAFLQSQPTGL